MRGDIDCPVCNGRDIEALHTLRCGNFDGSTLYPTVRLNACADCGHVFNRLTPSEVAGLSQYYNQEYAPVVLRSVSKDADLPGSLSPTTTHRYAAFFELIRPHVDASSVFLDVGCASGGFLTYLAKLGFENRYGVEPTQAYLEEARHHHAKVAHGDAEHLGFANETFDVVVVEQVMEHLLSPRKAFEEAGRVLKKGGLLYIGVPDVSRYAECRYFDFYWLLMREHVQHFSIDSLSRLAAASGFSRVDYKPHTLSLMGKTMIMPNLSVLFRYAGRPQAPPLANRPAQHQIRGYLTQEEARRSHKRRLIQALVYADAPVYCWGIGREFLYLYENTGLDRCRLAGLVDLNQTKQAGFAIDGRPVVSPDILRNAVPDSRLIITAPAHETDIRARLDRLGFKGSVIAF